MASTNQPTIVICHQSLESTRGGVRNGAEVREILEQANQKAGRRKVIACLSGHHHTDYVKTIQSIPYIQINSMAYKAVGMKNPRKRFGKHIEHTSPLIKYVAPYLDPLYTVLTIDPKKKTLHIEGAETSYISPSPFEMKLTSKDTKPRITECTLAIK